MLLLRNVLTCTGDHGQQVLILPTIFMLAPVSQHVSHCTSVVTAVVFHTGDVYNIQENQAGITTWCVGNQNCNYHKINNLPCGVAGLVNITVRFHHAYTA